MANRRGKCGSSDRFPLLGLHNHCAWWLQSWSEKTTVSWQESYDIPRECVEKQRRYCADKVPNSRGCGLPSGHVWLWELDHEEGRMPMNWYLQTMLLENTPESPMDSKEIIPVSLKRNQPWILIGRSDAEAPEFWSSYTNSWLTGKVPDAGKDWEQKERRVSVVEMVWLHHWCNGRELGQSSRDGERQEGLACCSPWGLKELDMTEWLINNKLVSIKEVLIW